MECPHCNKIIPDTAIRCKYCRRPINDDIAEEIKERKAQILKNFFKNAKKQFIFVLTKGRAVLFCPWTFLDVLIFTALIALFIFYDPFHLGANVLKFLRTHFFIFTKEPKLLYYLTIYISTILLKFISVIFLIILIKFRKIAYIKEIIFSGKVSNLFGIWLPIYIGICLMLRVLSVSNPLVPNIPFNSVFIEAKVIGNLVIIFAVLFVAPFVEEVLFRGFLYPALNKYLGMYPSIILTSLLFTFAHYPQIKDEFVFMLVIFVLSLMITYAKAKTGSTKLAIIMHHLYNLVYVGVGFIDYLIFKY